MKLSKQQMRSIALGIAGVAIIIVAFKHPEAAIAIATGAFALITTIVA